MISVAPIIEIINTAYASAMLTNDRPISVLLIAEPDDGKSHIVLSYIVEYSVVLSDFTSKGLHAIISQHSKPPLVLVCPDMNAILSHRYTVSGSTVANLLSLLEEGSMKVADAGAVRDFQGFRVSMIACMTPAMLRAKRAKWRSIGMLRRFLPIAYTYTPETVEAIHASIRSGSYKNEIEQAALRVPSKSASIKIEAPMAREIDELVRPYAEIVEARGFTLHKMARSYVKARALLAGRRIATQKDLEHFKFMLRFVNPERPHAI
jgi:hypothetical protein